MSRTERLLELITVVKATGGRFTVQEMSDRFGISRRTMLRDLQALSALGVPLSASPGPGGGYSLAFPQPPVVLSLFADEALGLILSYEAVLQDAPSPFRDTSVSAITKLRTALPPSVVQQLDLLRRRVAVHGHKRIYDAPFLPEILKAAADEMHLQIEYESRRAQSKRLIFPYGLICGLGFWYCACYDYERGAHSWLRIDRILAIECAPDLSPRAPMTITDWLCHAPHSESKTLRLIARVTQHGMKELDWSAFHEGLTENQDGSGAIDILVPPSSLDFYARLFLPLGKGAVVESPAELISLMRTTAQDVLSLYRGK